MQPRIRFTVLLIAAVAIATSAGACRRPAGNQIVLTKDQEQQIAAHVLTAPPALANKADTRFEDKITLLGWEIGGKPTKGGSFDLTMVYRCDQPVQGDWKVFVHFEAPGKKRQAFDHYGVGGLYPISQWKKGEIIKDVVKIDVPADWGEPSAVIFFGFFDWGLYAASQQDRRLKVDQPGALKVEPDTNRVILTTINLDGAAPGGAAAARPPVDLRGVEALAQALKQADIVKADVAPAIDGKADDPAWAKALPLKVVRQPDGQPLSADLSGEARLAWDAEALYFTATAKDGDVRNVHGANDATLWEGDVIELFLRLPGQDGKYVELQFAPNGARFDAQFSGPRQPKWEDAARFETGLVHKVTVDGDVNADGADRGFTVEAKIPWKGLGLDGAPAVGAVIEANIYRIDDKGTHSLSHMGAWVPVGNDFHQLDGAGRLKIADAALPLLRPVVPAGAPQQP